MHALRRLVRPIENFPQSGITFLDVTPVVERPRGLRRAVDALVEPFRDRAIDVVLGIGEVGVVLGSAAAMSLDAGLAIVTGRPRALPRATRRERFPLHFGERSVSVHEDAIASGANVLVLGDVIATGATAAAGTSLIAGAGGRVAGCTFLVEVSGLGGRAALPGVPYHTVMVW